MGYFFNYNLGRERAVATETVKFHDQCQRAVSLLIADTVQPAGVFQKKRKKKNPSKRRGKKKEKIRSEKESATESNPKGSPFPPVPPIPLRTHALFNRSPPVSSSPRLPSFSFHVRSSAVCRLRPPPKQLRPFPHFPLASTALSGVENNGLRCVALLRFLAAPAGSIPAPSLKSAPLSPPTRRSFVVRFGFRGYERLGSWVGKAPPFPGDEFGAG
jgi:hypothetical protein